MISAPGDYDPEKSAATLLDSAPKYTFGLKTQVYKPSDTPGKLWKLIESLVRQLRNQCY